MADEILDEYYTINIDLLYKSRIINVLYQNKMDKRSTTKRSYDSDEDRDKKQLGRKKHHDGKIQF